MYQLSLWITKFKGGDKIIIQRQNDPEDTSSNLEHTFTQKLINNYYLIYYYIIIYLYIFLLLYYLV